MNQVKPKANTGEAALSDSNMPELANFRLSGHSSFTLPSFGTNHEILEKVIDGLLVCLKHHDGNIAFVSSREMLSHCDLPAHTLNYYYNTPFAVYTEIYTSIFAIITNVTVNCNNSRFPLESGMHLLLSNLRLQPKMLKILTLINDITIWQDAMTVYVRTYAPSWKALPENHWQFYFESFCFLFHEVLKKWSTVDFDSPHMKTCERLLISALRSNTIYSTEIESIFCA